MAFWHKIQWLGEDDIFISNLLNDRSVLPTERIIGVNISLDSLTEDRE